MPGKAFVGGAVDEEDEVVAVFEIAAEDLGCIELHLETLRPSGLDAVAELAQAHQKDALIRPHDLDVVIFGVEGAVVEHLHSLAFVIEEDRADGTGGGGDELVENSAEDQAAPRTGSSV
jgi:hypothetical protein